MGVLTANGLGCYAISTHLVGQAVCDLIDERHKTILPENDLGRRRPRGRAPVRAAQEMKDTAKAARRFFDAARTDQ